MISIYINTDGFYKEYKKYPAEPVKLYYNKDGFAQNWYKQQNNIRLYGMSSGNTFETTTKDTEGVETTVSHTSIKVKIHRIAKVVLKG